MSFGFFRGVWISLRAVNYTSQAFQQVAKDMKMLSESELAFIKQSTKMIQVGMIFMAMGAMVTMGIMNIIKSSEEGRAYMDQFGKSINQSLSKIGSQLLVLMRPLLDIVQAILNIVATNPQLRFLVATFLMMAGPILVVVSALWLLNQVITILSASTIMKVLVEAILRYCKMAELGTLISYTWAQALSLVSLSAMGIFGVLSLLMPIIGKTGTIIAGIIGVVIGLAVAFLALHAAMTGPAAGAMFMYQLGMLGAGLAIGGALAATYAASMPEVPEYQMGTSFVRKGGLAFLHPAEEVKSARESRIPSRMERGETMPTYRKSSWFIPISIGVVHTKADEETLVPMLKKVLKEELDQKV